MIDVIVLQYGSPALTVQFFRSIQKARPPVRIIFVDNGSTEEEYIQAAKVLKETRLPSTQVRLPKNAGFPRAVNIGLMLSSAPYVVIQGNDTEVFAGGYERMKKALDKEGGPSIVGPLASSCATPQKVSIMDRRWAKEKTLLDRVGFFGASHEKRALIVSRVLNEKVGELDEYISFFSVMLKRETVEKVGLLDPRFSPGFGEDNDYCYRVRRMGGRLLVALDVYMNHIHRATFSKKMKQDEILKLQHRNQALFNQKWRGR